jgi:hypothetical protein
VLYHAMKLYKLSPELHWSAGGYVWPVDRIVEVNGDPQGMRNSSPSRHHKMPVGLIGPGGPRTPVMRGTFSLAGEYGAEGEADMIRNRVEESGAIPIADAEISICTDWAQPAQPVGKERVPFASGGEMEKLIVNTLLVVFVP